MLSKTFDKLTYDIKNNIKLLIIITIIIIFFIWVVNFFINIKNANIVYETKVGINSIIDVDNQDYQSFIVYRITPNNKIFILKRKKETNIFFLNKYYIKKIWVEIPNNVLSDIIDVKIEIGNNKYIFQGKAKFKDWIAIEEKEIISKKITLNKNNIILEVPDYVKENKALLPVFKNIINCRNEFIVMLLSFPLNIMLLCLFIIFLYLSTFDYFNNRIYKIDQRIINIVYYLFFIIIISIGISIRIKNLFYPSFYVDELWRAFVISKPDIINAIKEFPYPIPLGYFMLNHFLVNIHNDLWVFRLTSAIPSVLSIIFLYLIIKQYTKNKIILLFSLFIISLNTTLIEYTNYFKHYNMDILCNLSTIYFLIRYIKTKEIKDYIIFITNCFISTFLSFTVIFIYPAVYLILLFLKIKEKNKKCIITIIIGGLLVLISILIHFGILYSIMNVSNSIGNWKESNLYDFYNYINLNLILYFKWIVKNISVFVNFLFFTISLLIILLFGRIKEFFIIISPLLTLLLFNFFGFWPLSTINNRVNIFLIIYFYFLPILFVIVILTESVNLRQKVINNHIKISQNIIILFLIIYMFQFFPNKYNKIINASYIIQENEYAIDFLNDNYFFKSQDNVGLYNGNFTKLVYDYYLNYNYKYANGKYKDFFYNKFNNIFFVKDNFDVLRTRKEFVEYIVKNKFIGIFLVWYDDYEEIIIQNLIKAHVIEKITSSKFENAYAGYFKSLIFNDKNNNENISSLIEKTYNIYNIGDYIEIFK